MSTPLEPADVRLDARLLAERAAVGWELDLVDLRSPAEVEVQGAVPDARAARVGDPPSVLVVDASCTTVLLCALGTRSTQEALRLRAAGLADVWSVDGGAPAWLHATEEGG